MMGISLPVVSLSSSFWSLLWRPFNHIAFAVHIANGDDARTFSRISLACY